MVIKKPTVVFIALLAYLNSKARMFYKDLILMSLSDGVYILSVGLALGFVISGCFSLLGYVVYFLLKIIDNSTK